MASDERERRAGAMAREEEQKLHDGKIMLFLVLYAAGTLGAVVGMAIFSYAGKNAEAFWGWAMLYCVLWCYAGIVGYGIYTIATQTGQTTKGGTQ